MKNHLLSTFISSLLGACTLASAETASAISTEAPSWTSNDNRTVQAHFLKLDGHAVVLEKDDKVFTVPFSRLCPQSIAQALTLGGLASPREVPKLEDTAKFSAASASAGNEPKNAPVVQQAAKASTSVIKATNAKVTTVASVKPVERASLSGGTVDGIQLHGSVAVATTEVPAKVQRAIDAGNKLQTKGYKYGGGRALLEDTGYDCSGSVSYVLIKAGLLDEARTSHSFATYGEAGPGKWLTIYASPGHVFMTICGLRLDTGGRTDFATRGPRWSPYPRFGSNWNVRHPPGL